LDVGCSTGGLLEILNKYTSWELYGVEPDKKSSSIAKKKGLNIYNGLLETYNPEQKFDMIILNHVLEHLPDPAKTIQKVNLLLKDNGVLVGEIPTCDCFERIIFGRYWQGYHLPRHLTWFSKTLLKQFLENNGFTNISIHMQAQPSCWQVSLRNYFTAKGLLYEKRKILNGHNIFLFLLSAPIIVFFLFFKQSNIIKFSALKQ
jgi:SAM-dependent methyltransferase